MNTNLDDLATFERDGYLVLKNAIPSDQVGDALTAIKRFQNANDNLLAEGLNERGRLNRAVNLHLAVPLLNTLYSSNHRLTGLLDRYFRKKACVYTSLYFEEGSQQAIHVDSPYFSTRPDGRYCGVWIALEDASIANGCLLGIPGGHKVARPDPVGIAQRYYDDLDDIPDGDQRLWDDYQHAVVENCTEAGLGPINIDVAAGDIVIWHSSFPHGGTPYLDMALTRRSVVFHVIPQGESVYHMDVFFNPDKRPFPKRWPFVKGFDRRVYFVADKIDLGHKTTIPISQLQPSGKATQKEYAFVFSLLGWLARQLKRLRGQQRQTAS